MFYEELMAIIEKKDPSMKDEIEIIDVNAGNVDDVGFFCCRNKRETEGYQRKLRWLKKRFAEGLRMKTIGSGGRGVIEYIPGEYAWRAVEAKGYMFIHCLWITGSRRNVGCATSLLNECIKDAKAARMKGVAMVTSEGHFSIGRRFLKKHGFESVGKASPSFELNVLNFGKGGKVEWSGDFDKRIADLGKGLSIFTSDQCPYFFGGIETMVEAADGKGIKTKIIVLKSSSDVRRLSPNPYGTFAAVYNGELLSYYPPGRKPFLKRLEMLGG